MERIGIITSGGDCGGLNAVIDGAALAAISRGISCYVIPNGYAGLYNLIEFDSLVELTPERLTAVDISVAGSEAGHSRIKVSRIADPNKYERIRKGLAKFLIDGLVISGGDDTGGVIVDLAKNDIKCVHAPKTMDLDLQTYSVGGDSTIGRIATFARDLRTTGRTHNRVMVIEVFGRYAGHTAFRGGIAAESDAILIPEIPVDFDVLYGHMKERYFERIDQSDVRSGTYLIVVAEGLKDARGEEFADDSAGLDTFGHRKLAGAGQYVCDELTARLKADPEVRGLMKRTGMFVEDLYEIPEVRSVTTGHLVRCGETSAFDVNFGLEAGAAAVQLLEAGIHGVTVAGVHGKSVRYMKTEDAIRQRYVDLDQVTYHEALGTCFGRVPAELDLSFVQLDSSPERHL
jgi:6-phosphofructokinase 1